MSYFWNCGTPSISRERFELETSNLAFRLITTGTNEKTAELYQRGSERGHVTYFWNFGTLPYLANVDTSNLACWLATRATNEKMQNYIKESWKWVTWPTFVMLEPIYILISICASNFRFGVLIDRQWRAKCKIRSKVFSKMSSDLIFVLSLKPKPAVDFQIYLPSGKINMTS